jgi:hypothetical protein
MLYVAVRRSIFGRKKIFSFSQNLFTAIAQSESMTNAFGEKKVNFESQICVCLTRSDIK